MRGNSENLDAPIPGEAPCLSSVVPQSKTSLAVATVVVASGFSWLCLLLQDLVLQCECVGSQCSKT
jgi:hypothetical protein